LNWFADPKRCATLRDSKLYMNIATASLADCTNAEKEPEQQS